MEHRATGFPEPGPLYLEPTEYFDFDDPAVAAFARTAADGAGTPGARAVKLFYAIRDDIRYDPYTMSGEPADYKASHVLAAGAAFCVPKANLMVAGLRALGIPAGLGLSNVTNHLCTERLLRLMGGETLFINHAYAVLHLGGRWIKAAPTFNLGLCRKFDVLPTEFDGVSDALFQEFDRLGRRHMEYVVDHGVWSDFDPGRVIGDFRSLYPDTIFEDLARERARNAARAVARFEDERPVA